VTASGNQGGVRHRGKGRFRSPKLPVNLRFTLPRGTVGGTHSLPVASFVVVVPGTYLRHYPASHIF